jgi:uncharacterized protein YndB with AHSA1/START domain
MTAITRPSTRPSPDTVRLERLLPGPAERVWAYLVESDKRARWLAAGEFDLRVGGKVRLRFDNCSLPNEEISPERRAHPGASFEGVITRLEPDRVIAYTWTWGDADTEVTYELTPRGKDTLLTIVHKRLGKDVVLPVMAGWDEHTGILADLLAGTPPRPFWREHDRLAKEYAAA